FRQKLNQIDQEGIENLKKEILDFQNGLDRYWNQPRPQEVEQLLAELSELQKIPEASQDLFNQDRSYVEFHEEGKIVIPPDLAASEQFRNNPYAWTVLGALSESIRQKGPVEVPMIQIISSEKAQSKKPPKARRKRGQYPTRESVVEALQARTNDRKQNNAGALQTGQHKDPALYLAAKRFNVPLPSAKDYRGGAKSEVRAEKYGDRRVNIYPDRESMGKAAAELGIQKIKELLKERENEPNQKNRKVRIVFAAAPSQVETIKNLVELSEGQFDWRMIEIFHMDEFAGYTEDSQPINGQDPPSFRYWLNKNLIRPIYNIHRIPRKKLDIHFIPANSRDKAELKKAAEEYGKALNEKRVDIVFGGYGYNGHVAFNDPPAMFHTNKSLIIVDPKKDPVNVDQQMTDYSEFFKTKEDIPLALTISMPPMKRARYLIMSVPGKFKAEAIKAIHALNEEGKAPAPDPMVPGTYFNTLPASRIQVFTDEAGASLLPRSEVRMTRRDFMKATGAVAAGGIAGLLPDSGKAALQKADDPIEILKGKIEFKGEDDLSGVKFEKDVLKVPAGNGTVMASHDAVDLARMPILNLKIRTQKEGRVFLLIKNQGNELLTPVPTAVQVPNTGNKESVISIPLQQQGLVTADKKAVIFGLANTSVPVEITSVTYAAKPATGSIELGFNGRRFVKDGKLPKPEVFDDVIHRVEYIDHASALPYDYTAQNTFKLSASQGWLQGDLPGKPDLKDKKNRYLVIRYKAKGDSYVKLELKNKKDERLIGLIDPKTKKIKELFDNVPKVPFDVKDTKGEEKGRVLDLEDYLVTSYTDDQNAETKISDYVAAAIAWSDSQGELEFISMKFQEAKPRSEIRSAPVAASHEITAQPLMGEALKAEFESRAIHGIYYRQDFRAKFLDPYVVFLKPERFSIYRINPLSRNQTSEKHTLMYVGGVLHNDPTEEIQYDLINDRTRDRIRFGLYRMDDQFRLVTLFPSKNPDKQLLIVTSISDDKPVPVSLEMDKVM
ncbi:MAG TPA: 6-phosphogluconolactonase, partial [bacterium]|nr:6-phosphogluconolactonase [bacterium]